MSLHEEEVEYPDDDIPEIRPRRQSPWQTAAAIARAPEFHFICCGTVYGATNPKTLALMRQVHVSRHKS
jgi:hypothetical protein